MGVLQEMFSADARVDLGDGHFSDGVMIVKSDGMNKSLSLDTKSMSSSETANALFSRAMILKELNATPDIADGGRHKAAGTCIACNAKAEAAW